MNIINSDDVLLPNKLWRLNEVTDVIYFIDRQLPRHKNFRFCFRRHTNSETDRIEFQPPVTYSAHKHRQLYLFEQGLRWIRQLQLLEKVVNINKRF